MLSKRFLMLLCMFSMLSASCATVRMPSMPAPTIEQWLATCGQWDDWNKPAPPLRVHANTYYVGTCGIAAILIVTDSGHILIDSGTRQGAEHVAQNVRSLGLNLRDVNLLLHSHEHFDHVGGLSYLKHLSGARLLASGPAAAVLSTGMAGPDDPQYSMHAPFDAAEVDGRVQHGQQTVQGDQQLTAVATPGHTPGALSWQWRSCVGDECLNIVYADSLSPVSREDYRFSDDSAYVEAFRAGLQHLENLDCDILLTPHPSASRMVARLGDGQLVDSSACKRYASSIRARLELRLSKEAPAQ